MASFAKVTLLGNLGADPETKYTPNGTMVVELRLAVNPRPRPPGIDLPIDSTSSLSRDTLPRAVRSWSRVASNHANTRPTTEPFGCPTTSP